MSARRTNRMLIGAVALVAVAAASAGITAAVIDDDDDTGRVAPVAAAGARVETETDTGGSVGTELPRDEPSGEPAPGDANQAETAGSATVPAGWDDDGLSDAEEDAQLLGWATIDAAEAERIALELVPGARVEGVTDIDEDRGRVVWDVDLRDADGREHDIQIDAGNGAVVEHDIDD